MDKHLALLAGKHLETKFVRVHAEKAPFLTGECSMGAGSAHLCGCTPRRRVRGHRQLWCCGWVLAGRRVCGRACAEAQHCRMKRVEPRGCAGGQHAHPVPAAAARLPQTGCACGCCPRWPSSSRKRRQTTLWGWTSWGARTLHQVGAAEWGCEWRNAPAWSGATLLPVVAQLQLQLMLLQVGSRVCKWWCSCRATIQLALQPRWWLAASLSRCFLQPIPPLLLRYLQRRWQRGWRRLGRFSRMRSLPPSRRTRSSSSARCGRAAPRGGQRATRTPISTEASTEGNTRNA